MSITAEERAAVSDAIASLSLAISTVEVVDVLRSVVEGAIGTLDSATVVSATANKAVFEITTKARISVGKQDGVTVIRVVK